MNFFTWLILGGLAGWLASIITKNNAGMGLIKNIVVGILGAIIYNVHIGLDTKSRN